MSSLTGSKTKAFPTDILEQLTWDREYFDEDTKETYKVLEKKFLSKGRWDLRYHIVFRHETPDGQAKLYIVNYREAATEMQDVDTFYESEPGMVECTRVIEKYVTQTIYIELVEGINDEKG